LCEGEYGNLLSLPGDGKKLQSLVSAVNLFHVLFILNSLYGDVCAHDWGQGVTEWDINEQAAV